MTFEELRSVHRHMGGGLMFWLEAEAMTDSVKTVKGPRVRYTQTHKCVNGCV